METKRTIELTEASGLMFDAMRAAYQSLDLATKAISEHYGSPSKEEEHIWHGVCDAYGQYKDKLQKILWMMAKDNMSFLENGTICNRI